jgi:hypothetical protein
MMTKAGFIDALVLAPRDPCAAHTAYLKRRIAYAQDEFARDILESVLDEFERTFA